MSIYEYGTSFNLVETPFKKYNMHSKLLNMSIYEYGTSFNLVETPFKKNHMHSKLLNIICKTVRRNQHCIL